MKHASLTLVILCFCGINLYLQTDQEKADQLVVYPGLEIGMTPWDLIDKFGLDRIQADDENNFPGPKFTDTNLYDIAYIQLPDGDTLFPRSKNATLYIKFYKTRAYSVHYTFFNKGNDVTNAVREHLIKLLGENYTFHYYSREQGHDYHSPYSLYYDAKYTWKGNKYTVELLSDERAHDEYGIEIVRRDENVYKSYLGSIKQLKHQRQVRKQKPRKEVCFEQKANLGMITAVIQSTIKTDKLNVLEKSFPHSYRRPKIVYEKLRDENGVFWGLYDLSKKKYIIYSYNAVWDYNDVIEEFVVVTNMSNKVQGVLIKLKNYQSVSELEKYILKEDIVHANVKSKEKFHVYKDLLDQLKVLVYHDGIDTQHSRYVAVMQKTAADAFY